MVARSWVPASVLAFSLGCGGESVHNAPRGADGDTTSGGNSSALAGTPGAIAGAPMNGGGGSSGGTTQGAGNGAVAGTPSEPPVPTKNGVPISDCREPTPETLSASGCPPVDPVEGDACDLPDRTRCDFEITTQSGWSYQDWASCEGHAWSQIYGETCGATCRSVGPTRTLDTADCLARVSSPCERTSGPGAWPLSAFEASNKRLYDVVVDECGVSTGSGGKIELRFDDGCPSSLSASKEIQASEVDCLVTTLSDERWECAEPTPCVTWDLDIR